MLSFSVLDPVALFVMRRATRCHYSIVKEAAAISTDKRIHCFCVCVCVCVSLCVLSTN